MRENITKYQRHLRKNIDPSIYGLDLLQIGLLILFPMISRICFAIDMQADDAIIPGTNTGSKV